MYFGDFCEIEQLRHGVPNEFYTYKVVGSGRANYYMPVPVGDGDVRQIADMCDVVKVIRCGVCEEKVETFRLQDVRPKAAND